nr:PfkB family carbohydrate kinase [Streptomyces scabichelini]
MVFPGRFAEHLVAERLRTASLSFLVDRLTVRYGGSGANIAYGLGQFGLAPVLVGAAGSDFDAYQLWLKQHGVDVDSVLVAPGARTARFVRTTDADLGEMSAFHAGAAGAACTISLRSVVARVGGLDLVLVSSNDPATMLRHTEECRGDGIPFAAAPSRQLARMSRSDVQFLVSDAQVLFTDEYESTLLQERTGWSALGVLERVGARITTLGRDGVLVERAGRAPVVVPAVPDLVATGPSRAGDALKAGVLAGLAGGAGLQRAAQLGCALASLALEASGPQEYTVDRRRLYRRLLDTYGKQSAIDLAPALAGAVPQEQP